MELFARSLANPLLSAADWPYPVNAVFNPGAALVDGELVALDEQGRPSFQALHHQAARVIVYYAFDLLTIDGRDLTREPLDARRKQLAAAVTGTSMLLSEPLPGTPAQIERVVRELGLEGVVAKRRSSRYEAGRRSDKWLKVNAEYAQIWPNITVKREPMPEAKEMDGVPGKFDQYFSPEPGKGD